MSNFPTSSKFYVYCFKNDVNGKVYIGKTNDLNSRFNKHKSANGDCPIFHNAIKRYGIEKFQFQIIKDCETEEDAINSEIYFIEYYKSNIFKYGDQYGYNLTAGGDGLSGHKHSEASKLKMSLALKGRISPNKGKKASQETLLKLSKSHMGQFGYWTNKKLSKEHKQKLSDSHVGIQSGENHPMYGKIHSIESRNKISKAKIGKHMGEKNPVSKLTNLKAKKIRDLHASGNYTYDQLSKIFTLSRTTIFRVIKNPIYFSKGGLNE